MKQSLHFLIDEMVNVAAYAASDKKYLFNFLRDKREALSINFMWQLCILTFQQLIYIYSVMFKLLARSSYETIIFHYLVNELSCKYSTSLAHQKQQKYIKLWRDCMLSNSCVRFRKIIVLEFKKRIINKEQFIFVRHEQMVAIIAFKREIEDH